jgi:hypothetical protein
MNQYDSIYHLHVPRTAGMFLKNHLQYQFVEKKQQIHHGKQLINEEISSCYIVSGHYGTYPIKLMSNPLVFSVMRNPVERYISYYKYVRYMFPEYENNDLLDYWINDERLSSLHSNTHFKNFTGSINVEKFNKNLVNKYTIEENWLLENYSNNIQDGFDFIDKHHIFIFDDIKKLTDSICDLLNVKPYKNLYKFNSSDPKDYGITKKQYARIEELNSIDMELYEYAKRKRQ